MKHNSAGTIFKTLNNFRFTFNSRRIFAGTKLIVNEETVFVKELCAAQLISTTCAATINISYEDNEYVIFAFYF